jgi:hypothetical protein
MVQGKPLAHAVVTFLQADENGTLTVGETDENGEYELSYLGRPGTAAANYKVAISYLMGTDGTVYGLAPRSGLSKPYGLIMAKELLAPEWSDLGRTTQRATVTDKGGSFDFNVPDPLLPPPPPESPTKAEGSDKTSEPGKAKSEPSPAEEKSSTKPTPSDPTTKPKPAEPAQAPGP